MDRLKATMDVPLKEYIDQRLTDLDKRLMDRFTALDAGIKVLETAAWKTISRKEHDDLAAKVVELQKFQANITGRMLIFSGVVAFLAGIVGGAIVHWLSRL